jgi:folylpolyglutamate synthase
VPSVGSALEWLRSATRARPGLRLKVLVTGSLYLVGDVLRHLGRGGGD